MLEDVPPVEVPIPPLTTLAAIRNLPVVATQIRPHIRPGRIRARHVRGIVPQRMYPDAHPVHDVVKQIPLTHQNRTAVKWMVRIITATFNGGNRALTGNIVPLKVSAELNRSRSARRAGQESLRTPEKEVMADQPRLPLHVRNMSTRAKFRRIEQILIALETCHGAQPVRTYLPLKPGHPEMSPAVADVRARVKQSLPAAIAIVLQPQPVAAIGAGRPGRRPAIVTTEPKAGA